MPTLTVEPVQVFFDYTWPFTYRAHRWLDNLAGVRLATNGGAA